MTSVHTPDTRVVHVHDSDPAPYSRALRIATGLCLVLGGLLNGLPQYLVEVLLGDMEFIEQVEWGTTHLALHRTEQLAILVSVLFIPLGLLGLAHVTRWRAPRLTLVGTPLMLWGMWGFNNVLAMGYVSGTVAPLFLPLQQALALHEGLPGEPGVVATALVPHLVGSFFGVMLLTLAAWRSRLFSPVPCVLVLVFLVWDFLLPAAGPLEPHLLLAVAFTWMGITILRMPADVWHRGGTS